jgi:phosphatidylinositol glycan class S
MSALSQAPIAFQPGANVDDKDTKKSEDVPANAVSATPKKKEPPPESPESIRQRIYVVLSFWAIILIIGLPIWWKTTAIYRARLPLDQMMDWADGRVHLLSSAWSFKLTAPGLPTSISPPNIDRSRLFTRP